MSHHHPNPRSLLTPAMRGLIDRIARAGHPPLHALTPDQAKAAYAAGAGVVDIPPHKLARVEDLVIPARDDFELPARLYAPASEQPLPVLLYLHGGGFTVGSIATHEPLCRHLAHLAHCAVVSLMGGLTRGSETNTFEVSTELAKTLGAECYYLTAPVYSPSPESREILLTPSGVHEVMARARAADLAIVSCGDLTPRTKLTTIRSVQQRLPELSHCGAIGEILGTFIDAAGQPVDHELNRSVIALPPSDLKAATNSLLVSGGQYKAEVVSAVLAAQYVNGLVTDEDVARFVLARHGG